MLRRFYANGSCWLLPALTLMLLVNGPLLVAVGPWGWLVVRAATYTRNVFGEFDPGDGPLPPAVAVGPSEVATEGAHPSPLFSASSV